MNLKHVAICAIVAGGLTAFGCDKKPATPDATGTTAGGSTAPGIPPDVVKHAQEQAEAHAMAEAKAQPPAK